MTTHNRSRMRRAATLATVLLFGLGPSGCSPPDGVAPAPEGTAALSSRTAEAPREPATTGPDEADPYGEWARAVARQLGLEAFPYVEVVRATEPLESQALVDRCLAEAGFSEDEYGAMSFPEDQNQAFALARYICMMQYPYDPRVFDPLTDAQVLFIRDYLVESALPCLADLGYDLMEPPSDQTFLAAFRADEALLPSSQLSVLGVPQSEIEVAIEQCPDAPPYSEVWEH